ncbi:MAG: phosphodiesterase [Gammaproteobacteria bacterium]|nr:phosphodiesterase [Gammaproteobacteria bacterium]
MSIPLKLIHITDLHLGDKAGDQLSNIDCDESLKHVMNLFKEDTYDALLITGDIAANGAREAYQRLQHILPDIEAPIYLLPGNHDNLAAMQQVFGQLEKNNVLGDWQIILLDSNEDNRYFGQLSSDELNFLEQSLQKERDKHSLIALHHPPVDIGSQWMDAMQLKNKNEFFAIIESYSSPQAIIWGHTHQEFDQQRKGVRLLSSPSTCSQFLPRSDQHQKDTLGPGYRWLELHADGRIKTGVIRVSE